MATPPMRCRIPPNARRRSYGESSSWPH
jgi:hypothetical protein